MLSPGTSKALWKSIAFTPRNLRLPLKSKMFRFNITIPKVCSPESNEIKDKALCKSNPPKIQ